MSAADFWANVDTSEGPDGCWPWLSTRLPQGYGLFTQRRYAHRLAWELHNRASLLRKTVVMHTCDNPPCCNPTHLHAGTQAENLADMTAKGRRAKRWQTSHYDSANSGRKVSNAEKREIRAIWREYGTGGRGSGRGCNKGPLFQKDLGAIYGIGKSTVSYICLYKSKSVYHYKKGLNP